MFRQAKFQQAIAKLVLMTFTTMCVTPALGHIAAPALPPVALTSLSGAGATGTVPAATTGTVAAPGPAATAPKPASATGTTGATSAASAASVNTSTVQPSGAKPGKGGSTLVPLQPKPGSSTKTATPVATDPATESARALDRLQELVKQTGALMDAPSSAQVASQIRSGISAIRSQYQVVQKLDSNVNAALAKTEAHIRAKGLSADILQRHLALVAAQADRKASLKKLMDALDLAANGKADGRQAVQQLAQWATRFTSQSGQTPLAISQNVGVNVAIKRGTLPVTAHASASISPIKPLAANASASAANASAATKPVPAREVQRLANSASPVGSLSGIPLPASLPDTAPTSADLADSEESAVTPEIRTLAASLGNNPVQISNWVRNRIRFTPGFGSMQGAANTLQNLSGNAFDSASLLIALLHAANVPARYVYGTIEVPAARVQAWLGVDSLDAAQRLLTQAGIPNQATPTVGQATALQMEHVWVSAWVDYGPSRAAVNLHPNTWVPIDPSFKLVQVRPGLNPGSAISLNESGIFDGSKQGGACSIDAAQHLNAVSVSSGLGQYSNQLASFITAQGPDTTVGEVLGQMTIAQDAPGILPGSLPYGLINVSSAFASLPDRLRWQFSYALYADSAAQAQAQPLVQLSGSFSRLASQRITLSFVPASQQDADTLASFMPAAHADNSPVGRSEFPASIPGYLIRMKAELRVNGNMVASGGNLTLGSELIQESGSYDPAQGNLARQASMVHAGDYQAIALDAQGISSAALQSVASRIAALSGKLTANQTGGLTRDDVVGDLLYHTALHWFAASDASSLAGQRAARVVEQRLPSYGRAVAQVIPHLSLGVITSVTFPGVIIDIDQSKSAIVGASNGLPANAWAQQSAQQANAMAYQVLNQLYTQSGHSANPAGQAAASVNVLGSLAQQNQPVFGITASNINTLLPQVSLSQRARSEVQNAVARGYRVLIGQSPASLGGWNGQALLAEDNLGGNSLYRLIDDNGSASAALYLPGGMGWLALAQPYQAGASVLPTTAAAQALSDSLNAVLQENSIRWPLFPAKDSLAGELFLTRLAAAQVARSDPASAVCDRLTSLLATDFGSGFDTSHPATNNVPVITSIPVTGGTSGQRYQYPVSASDPQNAPLSFKLVAAPSAVSISSAGLVTWNQPVAGVFPITVRADNGQAYAEQSYVLSIGQQATPLSISLAVQPAIVNQGEPVQLTVLTNGGSGAVNTRVSVDGQVVTLDASGHATVTAGASGVHPVQVLASDSLGSVQQASLYSVRNAQDTSAPVAQITAPLDDAEITAPVTITGTAVDANLAYYQLLLRPAGTSTWKEIARSSTSVTNGTLGRLDPTQLSNGIYELALQVTDVNGLQTIQQIALDINRELKIGQFSISFEDLNLETVGIPIRVTRTYDTRRKSENLDFGYGWSVDYQNLQVHKNKVTGLQWSAVSHPAQFELCLIPSGKRKINVTLPTGKVERFTAANAKECEVGRFPDIDIRFTPLPGTTSKLDMVNVPSISPQGGVLYDTTNDQIWNQLDYKLTTEDKYVYYLTEGIGITRVEDRYGNVLTYGQNGILHSNGQSITFTRDAANRITTITDPFGKTIHYTYDANGDLVKVQDRSNASTALSYNRSHALLQYTNPNNVSVARYVYDDDGRLIASYDGAGNAIELAHDMANNKETVKNGRGFSTTYTYDADGNVTEVLNALNQKTSYGYDALGNETRVTNAANQTTSRTFDPQTGKQLTETDALNHTTTSVYTGTDLASYTDARQNVTNYVYGNDGTLSTNEPLGRTSVIGFDAKGNVNQLKIAGQTTTSTFDTKGNKLTETDAAGNVTSYTYDDANREISRSWTKTISQNGVPVVKTYTSSKKYDANGRVIEETDALGNVTQTRYDQAGQVIATIDAQGRATGFAYDSRGKLTQTTYPDQSTETTTYDAESNPVKKVDRQGRTTLFEYDALNRLTKTTYPDGSTSQNEYNLAGQVSATIDGNNNRTENTYDDAGRLVAVLDPQKRKTSFEYDANGNRTKVTDANQAVTQYEYDALNRLTKTTWPDLTTSTTVWRPDGKKLSETDAANKTTQYDYSPTGQLTQVKQTDGVNTLITQYAYDSTGNKATQIDAESRTTTWEFDANNRVIARTLPGQQRETFGYDGAGNLIQKTDFNGKITQFSYNNLQQPNLVNRPDGASIVTTYTASGQVASVTVTPSPASGLQGGKTSYEYDAQDRLTKQTNPDGSFLAWAYDANGNVNQRSTAAGTVKSTYTANGQLQSVIDQNGKTTSYTYDAANRLATTTLPNGTTTTRRYDSNSRLLQLVHRKADNSIITGVYYKLAANGQRLEMQELDSASSASAPASPVDTSAPATPPGNPLRTSKYLYDGVNRLTEEEILDRAGNTVRTTHYEFDKVGNRSKKTDITAAGTETTLYSYDSNDRLQQENKTTTTGSTVQTVYTWDNNGNLKSKAIGSVTTFYNWDSDNRLIEVKQGSSEATAPTLAKYRYDPNGNRLAKIEPGQNGQPDKVTSYLTDTTFPYAQVVQETATQGSATESTRYVWGIELIEQVRGGQGTFYHADGLGSTKALSDQNGNLTDSYQYDAYGNIAGRSGNTVNGYRFTGEYFDDVGLQYNRARWYGAYIGRFVSRDQLNGDYVGVGVAQTIKRQFFASARLKSRGKIPLALNKYNYAISDPVDNRDPTGKITLTEAGIGLLILGSLFLIAKPNSTSAIGSTREVREYLESEYGTKSAPAVQSTGWGDGGATHPDHGDEADALAEDGSNGCEALKLAIATLKAAIAWREQDLKRWPPNTIEYKNHKKRIAILQAHLEFLESKVYLVCVLGF